MLSRYRCFPHQLPHRCQRFLGFRLGRQEEIPLPRLLPGLVVAVPGFLELHHQHVRLLRRFLQHPFELARRFQRRKLCREVFLRPHRFVERAGICDREGVRPEGDNPALSQLCRLKERRDRIVMPVLAHVERVIARAPGRLATMTRAAVVTGCRQEELVTAPRTGLDHSRRQLTVRGKGNKTRVIDLDYEGGYELLRSIPVRLNCPWLFWHHDREPYRNVASRFSSIVKGEQKVEQ